MMINKLSKVPTAPTVLYSIDDCDSQRGLTRLRGEALRSDNDVVQFCQTSLGSERRVFHRCWRLFALTSLTTFNCQLHSQGVQWVHLHPQGGENFCRRNIQGNFVSAPPAH